LVVSLDFFFIELDLISKSNFTALISL